MRSASDDPDKVEILLETRAELAAQEQTRSNINQYKTEVDAGETALQNAVKAVERARALGTEGLNEASPSNQRTTLANEIGTIFSSLVGISRASAQSRYIFSGDTDQTAPFTQDLTQPNGVSPYAGSSPANRQAENSSGVRFNISKTAQEVFDNSAWRFAGADPA